jgi:hypothetical protein
MFLRRNLFLLQIFLTLYSADALSGSQNIHCGTVEAFKRRAAADTATYTRRAQLETAIQQWSSANAQNRQAQASAVVTIPVVVHVVWNTAQQNISDAQITSQIDRLNKDFRKQNTDMLASGHPFYARTGDAQIEFCLAQIDPNGNPTNGITRSQTTVTEFTDDDNVKFTSSGGAPAWDAEQYLNIWVCNLEDDLLGYAQFPSDLSTFPETDGVVIKFSNFGTTGSAAAPYNLGRTVTHEVGHWLNLLHTWGDDEGTSDECPGTDLVSDTPNQEVPTYDCPSGVVTDNCTATSPGILYQDFMDYTEDACMVLFTNNQISRMRAVLSIARTGIGADNKCSGPTLVTQQSLKGLKLYPNPVQNYLAVEGLPKSGSKMFTLDIYNIIGEKVYTSTFPYTETMLEMQDMKSGTYVAMIYNEDFSATQKITVVR